MAEADVVTPAQRAESAAARLIPLMKEYITKLASMRDTCRPATAARANGAATGTEASHGTSPVATALVPAEVQSKAGKTARWQRLEEEFQRDSFRSLQPAVSDLARQASQLIEFGALEPATRVELRLRLAELESLLRAVQRLLS